MPTIIMMISTQLYQQFYHASQIENYPQLDPFTLGEKPIYYNEKNLPLEEIIDVQTKKPIDPNEITIIPGRWQESVLHRDLRFHDYVKRMFCQWVEIAAYHPLERLEHISDAVWEEMSQTPKPGPDPPPPVSTGSVQAQYAENAAFRVIAAPLLSARNKWYVLIDPVDLDKVTPYGVHH